MMGFYGFILECDGNVYPCFNGEQASLGNLMTNTFEDIWFGEQATKVRRQLRVSRCSTCPETTYPLPINVLEVIEMFLIPEQSR
jgi:radical SAM protein with 4Fe4S-binding SPASM domain